MKRIGLALAAIVAAIPQPGQPAKPASPASSATPADEALFVRKCAICHGAVGPGTIMLGRRLGKEHAMLATRTDLDPAYIEGVVRGGLNSMPRFTRVELPDAQLAQVQRYLTRNNPKRARRQ